MDFRRHVAIGNENSGLMQNALNFKGNPLRTRIKQPLGSINNIIHNQTKSQGLKDSTSNGEITKKKKDILKEKASSELVGENQIYCDDFEKVVGSFKTDSKNLEQEWVETEMKDFDIFDRILKAEESRTKPITKEESDQIKLFEFSDRAINCLEINEFDFDFLTDSITGDFNDIDLPKLPELPPMPTLNFDDEMSLLNNSRTTFAADPVIAVPDFDLNFLDDSDV